MITSDKKNMRSDWNSVDENLNKVASLSKIYEFNWF